MSTPLEQNTATMEAILAAVNDLPSGGGGGSVESCTVTVNWSMTVYSISYQSLDGPVYVSQDEFTSSTGSMTFENVVKNSILTVFGINFMPNITVTGGVLVLGYHTQVTQKSFAISVTDSGTITLTDDD